MEYDIRNHSEDISVIRVAGTNGGRYIVELIEEASVGIKFIDSSSSEGALCVLSIHHWEDIKKGVEKAIQLGWVTND